MIECEDSFSSTTAPAGYDTGGRRVDLSISVDGGAGADVVSTGPGDDAVTPGSGNDTIATGTGSDGISAEENADGADTLDGGAGMDVLDYGSRQAPVSVAFDTRRTTARRVRATSRTAWRFSAVGKATTS